jgi:hypothetical protein
MVGKLSMGWASAWQDSVTGGGFFDHDARLSPSRRRDVLEAANAWQAAGSHVRLLPPIWDLVDK